MVLIENGDSLSVRQAGAQKFPNDFFQKSTQLIFGMTVFLSFTSFSRAGKASWESLGFESALKFVPFEYQTSSTL